MPGKDGTGPNGMGSMTGRGKGPCAGYQGSGHANRGGCDGGYNRGIGFRKMWDEPGFRGCGYDNYSAYPATEKTNDDKIKILKLQKTQIEMQLEQINKGLESLESKIQ